VRTSSKSIRTAVWALAILGLATPLRADPSGLPGAGVVRFNDQVGFFIIDQARGLMSFHGTEQTFAQLCSGVPITIEPLTIQLVQTPVGALHALFSGQEHPVLIYPAPSLPDPNHMGREDCPIIASLPVLASGRARLVRTDNDITVQGPGSDAFGWSATGTLKGASGADVNYNETVRALVIKGADEIRTLQLAIQLLP